MMTRREERIRERAKKLWEEAGRPEGRDNEFWHRAEEQINAEPIQSDDPAGRPIGGTRRS